ncbi:hypothetical protein LSAT2_009678 [Lamellibrachia satsuma]|nr:hypothetical protein LSAT2_009678 [Lamellibrachia satsuma]
MAEADREGATVAMLMKLGAKAPKKQYINYKLLLESKKQKTAEEERLKSEADHTSGHKASAASSKKKRSSAKKDRNDIGYIDGQVGRYKGGVQLVSQSDLQSSAGKKRKKSRK